MQHVDTRDWIIPFQQLSSPGIRLFCFANAGGNPAQFRSWQGQLPKGTEVSVIQLPGQGSRVREQPYTSLAALVDTLIEVLGPYMDTPFAFWGHSMGALIAYNLTMSLYLKGPRIPSHLFVAGRRAPQIPPRDPPIHVLPQAEFIHALQIRYNGIPDVILKEPDLLALYLPILRANFEMIECSEFEPTKSVDCPIWAFGGLGDPMATFSEIGAWRELTSRSFQYFMFPGDHFFVQHHQSAVLQVMSKNFVPFLT